MNRKPIIYSVLVILLIICAALFIKHNYEWKEVEVNSGMSAEAHTYKYLAARRFLDKAGVYYEEIESNEFFYQLPPETDTIFLGRLQSNLTDAAYENLLNWVEDGGHLVFGLPYSFRIEFFGGLETYDNNDGIEQFLHALQVYPTGSKSSDSAAVLQHWELRGATAAAKFSARLRLKEFWLSDEVTPTLWAGDGARHVYAQFPYAAGRVTVLSVPEIWMNDHIGHSDNAYLLMHTIANDNEYSTLHLGDRHTDLPGIVSLIFRSVPWLCALLAVLGLAVLRRSSVRFGPVLTSVKPQSNNFARYLHSKSRFHQRTQTSATLLAAVRARVRGVYNTSADKVLTDQEIIQRMATSSKLPKKDIYTALMEEKNKSGESVVQSIRVLQLVSRAKSKRVNKL